MAKPHRGYLPHRLPPGAYRGHERGDVRGRAEVLGYLGWGLIDILSSQGDMRKRYGVVYVNREKSRPERPEARAEEAMRGLKQVIHTNGREM